MNGRFYLALCVILLSGVFGPGGSVWGQTTTGPAPDRDKLIRDQLKIVKHPNTPLEARKIAAGTLLDMGDPTANEELQRVLLNASDPVAQLAVVEAIADRDDPDPVFKAPLITLLLEAGPSRREVVAGALGRYRDPALIGQLRDLAGRNRPLEQRLAVIGALGKIRSKGAVETLITLMTAAESEAGTGEAIRSACGRSLQELTRLNYKTDTSAWQAYWKTWKDKSEARWFEAQLVLLAAENRTLGDKLGATEQALIEAISELIRAQAKTDVERVKKIQEYLVGELPAHRRAALAALADWLAQHPTLPEELEPAVRELIFDPDASVRRECAALLGAAHDEKALDDLRKQLAVEEQPAVLRMLLVAMGHLGKPTLLSEIREYLKSPDESVALGAADAIGRIYQDEEFRRTIVESMKGENDKVVAAFWGRYGQSGDNQSLLKEELLRNMAYVGDWRFLPTFQQAMGQVNPNLRLYAARGLVALSDPKLVETDLLPHIDDPAAAVRECVATGIASLTSDPKIVEQFLLRMNPEVEKDKAVRERVGKAILDMIKRWSMDDQLDWAERVLTRTSYINESDLIKDLGDRIDGQAEKLRASVFLDFGSLLLHTSESTRAAGYFRQALDAARREANSQPDQLADTIAEKILKVPVETDRPVLAGQFMNVTIAVLSSQKIEALADKFVAQFRDAEDGSALREFLFSLSNDLLDTLPKRYREQRAGMSGVERGSATQPATTSTRLGGE